MHIVRAGEFRRAVRWKLELGSTECEFVSLVSLYNPSAGNIAEKETQRGAETDSTNSQTHTNGSGLRLTEEQERRIRDLVQGGIAERVARRQVLGEHPPGCICEECVSV